MSDADATYTDGERWDVIVIGAGPAGSSAARGAAESGARVLLLDAARFPRYKTCGGGLIGASFGALPASVAGTIERHIDILTLSVQGRSTRRVRSATPFLALVDRAPFDQALVDSAVAAGATFRDGVRVRGIDELADTVSLRTADGVLIASVVIGADGSAGLAGRYVGVRIARADLGLEVELTTPAGDADWSRRVHMDWGTDPGTYGWVFPKAGRLTVGVIERKGRGSATRAYLERFVHDLGFEGLEVERSSGHLTQWRRPGSPVRRGRVLVAGDAAGLLEPWTREGISFALRSGALAGAAAADAVRASDAAARDTALDGYTAVVRRTLEPEQRAGALLLRLFERHPRLIHLAFTRTGSGATAFVRFCRGTLTLDRVVRHRILGPVFRLLAAH